MTGVDQRLRILIAAVLATGVAIAGFQLTAISEWSWRDWAAFLVVGAAAAAAQRFLISLPYRGETQSFSVIDGLWAAGLLLLEPSVLILAAACGVVVGQLLRKVRPHKVAFNAGAELIALGLAVAIYAQLAAGATAPSTWLFAFAAMLVYLLVNAAIVSLAISIAVGERYLPVLLEPLPQDLFQSAAKVSLGILFAVVWAADPIAVSLLTVPVLLAQFAYRGWLQSARERERMHAMARAADEISEQGDLDKRIDGGAGDDAVGTLAATLNRMLDRLERSFQHERRFISEASHELRTPLTICRGYLEVLGPHPAPERIAPTTSVVLDELDLMSRLIDDLATLARSDDREFVQREPVELERFRQEVVRRVTPLLDGSLESPPAPAGAHVEADPDRLTQAVVNLLQNAAVHTAPGTPVELRIVERNGSWRFEVEDRGEGLPSGKEETVFEPFARAGARATGSGLGLAIVRKIAEAHGGGAGVENRPGEGATFWLEVPR
jgi:signal transduction histidine kinase